MFVFGSAAYSFGFELRPSLLDVFLAQQFFFMFFFKFRSSIFFFHSFQTQERDAKQKMREKSKELQRLRDDSNKRGGAGGMKSMNSSMGSIGYGGGGPSPMVSMASSIQVDIPKATYQPPMPSVFIIIYHSMFIQSLIWCFRDSSGFCHGFIEALLRFLGFFGILLTF